MTKKRIPKNKFGENKILTAGVRSLVFYHGSGKNREAFKAVVDVRPEEGKTIVIDPATYSVLKVLATIDRWEVMKAVRHMKRIEALQEELSRMEYSDNEPKPQDQT